MKTIFKTFVILFVSFLACFSQQPIIHNIEPPNWWANHPYNKIELLIHGQNLDSSTFSVDNSNIKVENVTFSENGHYAFVNLFLDENCIPSENTFFISNKYGSEEFSFPILQRDTSQNIYQGFSQKDIIYLIFPDRFVNGDNSNDFLFNDKEEFEFGSLNGRHGGDIQGIINKLDYLVDLGITAIWSTPLLENNMYMSYHGYAATNLYKIDPRFGTNQLYFDFVKEAHKKGIKVILDFVPNHVGINHIWMKDLPTETWLNGSVEHHLGANHNKLGFVDPYVDSETINHVQTGWFENYMPDLNQTDSKVAKYLTQNSIWWIESSGLDGIRVDTYPYNDQKFMSDWAKTILDIYPNFNIVGEVWQGNPNVIAMFQTNSYFPKEFDSNLPVVTDFAFHDVVKDYLKGNKNLSSIYEIVTQDFVYSNPNNLLVFLDNHDVDRAMFSAKGNIDKFKKAFAIMLTTRGIPQIFYGTELGLDGGGHHGLMRSEFPGGFMNDCDSEYTESDRTERENDIFNFTRKLLKLRTEYSSLNSGKLVQFQPKDNIYVFRKSFQDEEIIIVINDKLDNFEDQNIEIVKFLSNEKKVANLTELLTNKIIYSDKNGFIKIIPNSISLFLIN